MSQRSTGPAGPPADGEWPDDLWPADDEVAGQQGDPAPGSETPGGGTPGGGIKVGDQVSAQLTQGGDRVTAVTIADPAQAPAGGSLP